MWEVAYELGMADCNFSRLLRRELPPEKKQEIRDAILRLVEKKSGGEVNAS